VKKIFFDELLFKRARFVCTWDKHCFQSMRRVIYSASKSVSILVTWMMR